MIADSLLSLDLAFATFALVLLLATLVRSRP